MIGNNTPAPVVKVDKLTREVVARYESLRAAAKAERTKVDHMLHRCNDRMLPRGRYYFRYADDFDPDEVFKGSYYCPVLVTNKKTGEKLWYPCKQEFLSMFEIKTVRTRIPMGQVKQ